MQLEGLESYKIELNEIYADKIALNSDYMTQVRPLDLFPQEDECEAISMEMEDDATVDSSPALPNGKLQSDQPDMRRAMPRRTISRSRTIGRGLSGADYDWEDDDVSPSASPSPNTPEKDLLTLLREKKDALKAWKEKKRREKERRKGEKDKERSSKGECKQLSEDEGHSEGESDSSDASASVAGRADSRDLAAAHEKEYYDMSRGDERLVALASAPAGEEEQRAGETLPRESSRPAQGQESGQEARAGETCSSFWSRFSVEP